MAERRDADRLPGAAHELNALFEAGHVREVRERCDAVLTTSTDVLERAVVAVQRMPTLIDADRRVDPGYRAAEDAAREAVERAECLSAVGCFHAFAALADCLGYDWDAALAHLLDGEQALAAEPSPTFYTVLAWRYLAFAQSAIGLPEPSVASMARCEEYADRWPLVSGNLGPHLNAALVLDHLGDTPGCVRELEKICGMVRAEEARGFLGLSHWDTLNASYAAARLLVLGGDPGVDPRRFLPAADSPNAREPLRRRVLACAAIAGGRPEPAVAFFDSIPVDQDNRVAEVFRLRSIAHGAMGDHAGALAAERQGFRLVSEHMVRVQRALAARANQGADPFALHASLAGYALEALTDPLTALPNRRHLDRRLDEMVGSGRPAALGVLDLDRFKQINTVHGHVGGDLVLRRVAEVLTAAFRSQDFVARYGGDEFVVLLPDTSLDEARRIGERATAAVAEAVWDDIAPGTPVGASIGWTDLGAHRTPSEAVAAADQAMYAQKPVQP